MADSVLVQFAKQAEAQVSEPVVAAVMLLIYPDGECQLAVPVDMSAKDLVSYCAAAYERACDRLDSESNTLN